MEDERAIHNREKIFAKYTAGKRGVPRESDEFLLVNKKKNPVQKLANAFPKRRNTDG